MCLSSPRPLETLDFPFPFSSGWMLDANSAKRDELLQPRSYLWFWRGDCSIFGLMFETRGQRWEKIEGNLAIRADLWVKYTLIIVFLKSPDLIINIFNWIPNCFPFLRARGILTVALFKLANACWTCTVFIPPPSGPPVAGPHPPQRKLSLPLRIIGLWSAQGLAHVTNIEICFNGCLDNPNGQMSLLRRNFVKCGQCEEAHRKVSKRKMKIRWQVMQ